jgi:Nuclease-related domain.
MIVLKKRGVYLDDKSGGDGLTGGIIRVFSQDARNCNKGRCGEDTVTDVLQGLDDSCYLINDVTLPSSRGNIDHVLLTPKGIFAIETKHWDGEIICNGDEWYRRYQKGFFSSTDYEMGSPSRQVKRNAFNLSSLIKSEMFHNTFKIWVEGLVVFTNPYVSLELNEPSVTILKVNELFNYIINFRQTSKLFKNDLESIGDFIVGASENWPIISDKEVLGSQRNNQEFVLRILVEHGGSMGNRELERYTQIKFSDLDRVLQELERAGKVKLTKIKGCRAARFGERLMHIDYLSQLPEEIAETQPPSEKESKAKHWWQFWK